MHQLRHVIQVAAGALALGGALPVLGVAVAHADTPLPPSCTSTDYPGFGSATDLTRNGRAAVVTTPDGQVLRVTNNAGSGAGSAFTTSKVTLADQGSFSTAFAFRISGQANGGADGLTFTVQNVANNVGTAGGGMGYQNLPTSIAVEFDDWNNHPDGINDPNDNHVGIDVNGNINSVQLADLSPIVLDDPATVKHAWVDYDGATQQLEVRVAGVDVRPALPTLSYHLDLPAILGGTGAPAQDAFVGFTAATGFAAANFDVLSWSFRNCYQPVGVDASPTADAGGPYDGHAGDQVALDGTVSDDNPGVTGRWSLGQGVPGATCAIQNLTSPPSATVTCDKVGTYELRLTATDSAGQTASDTAALTITNRTPVAGALDLRPSSACAVDATLHFTDGDPADTHTVGFDWGDGSQSTGAVDEAAGTGTASHTFAHAGTYTVTGTVSDGEDSDSRAASYATRNSADAFQQPINAAGTRSVFKLGSTIPVKIVVRDCDGAVVSDLTPMVLLTKLDATSTGGTPETPADVVATNGRAMSWTGDHYQFNLSTKRSQFAGGADLTTGSYRITVSDPTLAAVASVVVDLR